MVAITRALPQTGNVTSQTDPLARTTTVEYDAEGHITRLVLADPDGAGPLEAPAYSYVYDSAGNLASQTDPLGRTTEYTHDAQGRLTGRTDPDPDGAGPLGRPEVAYTYDDAGRMTALTDPVGNTTSWTYDAAGRPVSETNALGDTRQFSYDSAGHLTAKTDRNGRLTEYAYDSRGNRTLEVWLDDAGNVVAQIAYGFDLAGQLVSIEHTASGLNYAYEYDRAGRLVEATSSGLGFAVVLSYAYDAAGQRTVLDVEVDGVPDLANRYSYDPLGRLVSLVQTGQTGGNAVVGKQVDFAYDAAGEFTGITRYLVQPDGSFVEVVETTFTRDLLGRLTGIEHSSGTTILASYAYSYDAAGQIVQVVSLADGTVTYTYDALGQLIGADYSGSQPDEVYSYDLNGNRTMPGYVTGLNNQLLSDGTHWYEYDGEGNRTLRYVWTDADSDGVVDPGERSQLTEYVWDQRNRLVGVVNRDTEDGPATLAVQYVHDAYNRLVARALDPDGAGPLASDTTYYVYDGTQILLTLDSEGHVTHRYLWGSAIDQILADESASGDLLWPLADHLGTVRDVAAYNGTSGEAEVVSHRAYSAYGKLLSETAAADHVFAFTGRLLDEATGLQNNWNRWYDPLIGRWASRAIAP